jgi:hypothetical protein
MKHLKAALVLSTNAPTNETIQETPTYEDLPSESITPNP